MGKVIEIRLCNLVTTNQKFQSIQVTNVNKQNSIKSELNFFSVRERGSISKLLMDKDSTSTFCDSDKQFNNENIDRRLLGEQILTSQNFTLKKTLHVNLFENFCILKVTYITKTFVSVINLISTHYKYKLVKLSQIYVNL